MAKGAPIMEDEEFLFFLDSLFLSLDLTSLYRDAKEEERKEITTIILELQTAIITGVNKKWSDPQILQQQQR